MNTNKTKPSESVPSAASVFARLGELFTRRHAKASYAGDDLVCTPDTRTMSRPMRRIGLLLRVLVIYAGVLGMLLFLSDAMEILPALWMLMLAAAVSVGTFTLLCLGKRLAGWCAFGAECVFFLLFTGRPIDIIPASVSAFWNRFLWCLDPKLFVSVYLPQSYPEGELGNYAFYGMCMFGALLSAVVVFSALKRVYMLPVAAAGLLVVLPITTYNVSSSNWGFALILTSLVGFVVMRLYDGIFNRNHLSRRHPSAVGSRSAMAGGGYAGFAAAVMAFVLMAVPAATMHHSFRTISFIYDRMVFTRTILTAIITGNDFDNGYLAALEQVSEVDAASPTYYGKTILELNTSFKMPLYLRAWTGDRYENNAWYSVENNDAKAFSAKFGEDFTPDQITYSFYDLYDSSLLNCYKLSDYYSHVEHGFTTETIDIGIRYSTNNMLYATPHINTARMLMKRFSDSGEAYQMSYRPYYDSTYIAGILNFSRNYRTVALVPSYISPQFARNLWQMQQYYDVMYRYVQPYLENNVLPRSEQLPDILASAIAELDALEISYPTPTILEQYLSADAEERQAIADRYFTAYNRYTPFVEEHYTAVPEDSVYLSSVAEAVRQETEFEACMAIKDYHGAIIQALRYLGNHYTYTLTPSASADTSLSALDAFLGETKEGYYVQFATAATMLLRELGFPARYCEGYLVTEFEYDSSAERLSRYYKTVYDTDTHAWTEVYLPGIGWMPYETVADNFAYFYAEESEEIFGMNHQPELPEENGNADISDWEAMQEEKRDEFYTRQQAIADALAKQQEEAEKGPTNAVTIPENNPAAHAFVWVLAVGVAGLVYLVIFPLPTRRRRAKELREMRIAQVLAGEVPAGETLPYAGYFCHAIWALHAAAGCRPRKGELPREYVARVDEKLNVSPYRFAEVLSYMNRQEFGPGMDDRQLRETVEYYQANREKTISAMTPWRRYWHANIRCDL